MAFRWLSILAALLLSGGPLFAATKEQSAYAAAVADFRSELWSRAEMELAQFRQKYPGSTNVPEAVLLQAQAAFKQGKLAVTVTLLSDPGHLAKAGAMADEYVYWTGEAQYSNRDFAAAADTFVSLARKYPASPLRLPAVVSAAAADAQLGDWRRHDALLEETNGVFQQVARLDPGNALVVDGWLSLENSKCQQRDFAGAVAIYERLTNRWQLLNQVQRCQGVYLFYRANLESGDLAAALTAATNLVQLAASPTNPDWLATGWAAQGEALERIGRQPDAIEAWRNILTNAPARLEREAVLKIAEQEMVQGQLAQAEEALTNFLAQFAETNFAGIALLTVGELHLKEFAADPAATNQLSAALERFNQLLGATGNSATADLAGKAYLDRGWCEWLAGDLTNSLADFEAAAQRLPPSEDQAVARFKSGDALLALANYPGALDHYRAVLEDFTNFPMVAATLGSRALYQSLRANLRLANYAGASSALARILNEYPTNDLAAAGELLYGQSLVAATNEPAARAVFRQFLARFPDSPLRPRVEFAVARAFEGEEDWTNAIAGYEKWLADFPTNGLRPQVDYALALAHAESGDETNAFTLFSQFISQNPTNELLTPLAQWWLADYSFGLGNYVDAEKNYQLIYQKFPTSSLAYEAQMMAGRAAVGRQDYKDANNYFVQLMRDTNCPVDVRVRTSFADGDALMQMDSPYTNNPQANFSLATNVFASIIAVNATNEAAARAWGRIGECDVQLTAYDAATNAYAQVVDSPAAGVSLRSQARIGWGVALEKMAASASGTNQVALLQQALGNYLDVFDTSFGKDLRAGETADAFWVAEAGRRAAATAEALGEWQSAADIYARLKTLLPQLADSLDKKIAAAKAHTPELKN